MTAESDILIAGRNVERASRVASELGHGVRARHIDVRGVGGVHMASVQGHGQANATALSAAAFLRALVEGEVDRPGIWTADQVVPVGPFLTRLAAHGLVPTIHVSERADHPSRPTILSEVIEGNRLQGRR